MNYTAEEYDILQSEQQKIEQELEELENQGWDKKSDRIKKYVYNARILLEAGKLPVSNKSEFCSYLYHKLTQRNITGLNNGRFYSLFSSDEKKLEMSRIDDNVSANISSGRTTDEIFRDKVLSKPKKETAYTKYLEKEMKTLDDAKSLNNALLEKYNEDDEYERIMDDNFNEDMVLELIEAHSVINLARKQIDDRNKLSNYQKLNLQLLVNLGQTKAKAAQDVGYCSKYLSIGIERNDELTKLWDWVGECHVCHSDIKAVRDKAIQDYESGNEIDFDVPIKGY